MKLELVVVTKGQWSPGWLMLSDRQGEREIRSSTGAGSCCAGTTEKTEEVQNNVDISRQAAGYPP